MTGLLDAKGRPVSSQQFKKGTPPKTGEAFAVWGENDNPLSRLPMGGIVQFNLENLTVHDYRAMRTHYQVNASLAVLSFMQHQSDWHIECEGVGGAKIAAECEEQLRNIWTPLNRALSAANWAGYSPNILQWENDNVKGRTVLDKIKDLVPESAEIHWKEVDAWKPPGDTRMHPPKVKIYDGIKQVGSPWPIPVSNTLWYPLLMENGNYKGRNLLKAAFTSWYFSILIHLFANRYYERFGEPIVVGRAPFEDDVKLPGSDQRVNGIEYMLKVISDLRSRSVVALPNDASQVGDGNRVEWDYDLEYLESQMRGADWERYLTRLDEEISIGLFTPILLLRTADVGSYNLGVGHLQMYLWMMNAMNSDRAQYIDKYILSKMTDYNFSPNAPRPRIKFRKLGNQNSEVIKGIVDALMTRGTLGVDIQELGEIAGLSLKEIRATVQEEDDVPNPDDDDPGNNNPERDQGGTTGPRATAEKITARVRSQVEGGYRTLGRIDSTPLDLGYRRKMERSLFDARVADPVSAANTILQRTLEWANEAKAVSNHPNAFMDGFSKVLEAEIREFVL